MADFPSWFQDNWSSIIGAAGIIASLCFSAVTTREDCKSRQVGNLLALDERHRALWGEAQQREDLKRILSDHADILAKPPTPEEEVFLRRVILQFETGWRLEKIMNRGELDTLALDASDFFRRPLPKAVWEKTKQFRNPRFARFVDRALDRRGRLTDAGA